MERARYSLLDNLPKVIYAPSERLGPDSYVWLKKTPAADGAMPPRYRYENYDKYVDGRIGYWPKDFPVPAIVKCCSSVPMFGGYVSYNAYGRS